MNILAIWWQNISCEHFMLISIINLIYQIACLFTTKKMHYLQGLRYVNYIEKYYLI